MTYWILTQLQKRSMLLADGFVLDNIFITYIIPQFCYNLFAG